MCRGSGQEIEEYCPTCKGRGANSDTKEVQIRVPAGIENGATMRVRDAGNAGKKGGPRGDLFVNLVVKRSEKFKRDGTEIYSDEEVSYVDAILGAKIMAETVDGKTEVIIPPGTQPEQRLRLRGKGAPKLGTDIRGDAYLTVKVKIPTSISGKEKELIEALKAVEDGKRKKDKGGFFSGFNKE
jgi:molecular chaperone DnaJ